VTGIVVNGQTTTSAFHKVVYNSIKVRWSKLQSISSSFFVMLREKKLKQSRPMFHGVIQKITHGALYTNSLVYSQNYCNNKKGNIFGSRCI